MVSYNLDEKEPRHKTELMIPLSLFGQQMYDTDRSGCITKEEVASMLRVMPLNFFHFLACVSSCFNIVSWSVGFLEQALPDECLPANITEPGKLDEIFDRMDANSDGKVTFEEFRAAMQIDSSLQDIVLSSLRPK